MELESAFKTGRPRGADSFLIKEPSLIKDRSLREEKNAKVRQVTRNMLANTVVVLIIKELVLAPKTDSAEEKLSVKPPPRPDCIKMTMHKRIQIKVWRIRKNVVIIGLAILFLSILLKQVDFFSQQALYGISEILLIFLRYPLKTILQMSIQINWQA